MLECGGGEGFSVCDEGSCDFGRPEIGQACAVELVLGLASEDVDAGGGVACEVFVEGGLAVRDLDCPVEPDEALRFGVVLGFGGLILGSSMFAHAARLGYVYGANPSKVSPAMVGPGRPILFRAWPGELGIQKPGSTLAGETLRRFVSVLGLFAPSRLRLDPMPLNRQRQVSSGNRSRLGAVRRRPSRFVGLLGRFVGGVWLVHFPFRGSLCRHDANRSKIVWRPPSSWVLRWLRCPSSLGMGARALRSSRVCEQKWARLWGAMRFFVLQMGSGSPTDAVFTAVDPSYKEGLGCPACARPLLGKEWVPPHRVTIEVRGKRVGDLVGGPSVDLLLSRRMLDGYRAKMLSGLFGLRPVEVVDARPKKAAPKKRLEFYLGLAGYGMTQIDEKKSHIERQGEADCLQCMGGATTQKVSGFAIDEVTFSGEDFFVPWGLDSVIVVTERVLGLRDELGLENVSLVPTEEYRFGM